MHDDTLERTTNGKGFPIDFNYDDLKILDAGFSFYSYFTKICIPTLKQILSFCKKNEMSLNIELKPNLGFEKKNVETSAKIIKVDNKYKFRFIGEVEMGMAAVDSNQLIIYYNTSKHFSSFYSWFEFFLIDLLLMLHESHLIYN